jgi:hypothetical protein
MRVDNPDRSPSESITETQPQLQPALLSLSAMISQYFILCRARQKLRRTAWLSFTVFAVRARRQAAETIDQDCQSIAAKNLVTDLTRWYFV